MRTKTEIEEIESSIGGRFTEKVQSSQCYVVYYKNTNGWHLHTASYGMAWTYKGFAKNCAEKIVAWGFNAIEAVVVDISTDEIVFHTARQQRVTVPRQFLPTQF